MYNFVRKFKIECLQVVTHPSTNSAQCCLTAVIGRELVFSTWYGRRQDTVLLSVKELNNLLYLDKIPFWEFRREIMRVYLNISRLTFKLNHVLNPIVKNIQLHQNSPEQRPVQTSEISPEPSFLLIKSMQLLVILT